MLLEALRHRKPTMHACPRPLPEMMTWVWPTWHCLLRQWTWKMTWHTHNAVKHDVQIHWASKETYHFFRATLTKIHRININHIWTQISYSFPHEAHLKNQMVASVKKEKNVKLQKVIFQKSHKLLAEILLERPPSYSEHSIAIHSISKADYITAVLAIFHTQLCSGRRAVSTSCDFTAFFFCLIEVILYFFRCALILRMTLANLCQNKFHFDAVDFSECRSEEVMSFFWRSVYVAARIVHVQSTSP